VAGLVQSVGQYAQTTEAFGRNRVPAFGGAAAMSPATTLTRVEGMYSLTARLRRLDLFLELWPYLTDEWREGRVEEVREVVALLLR
jgi:hypothetical protein